MLLSVAAFGINCEATTFLNFGIVKRIRCEAYPLAWPRTWLLIALSDISCDSLYDRVPVKSIRFGIGNDCVSRILGSD